MTQVIQLQITGSIWPYSKDVLTKSTKN